MRKQKLLPVKEVRALAKEQSLKLAKQNLEINRLRNEVESLEGARQNLRMMYDTHEMEKNRAIQEKVDALASLRESQRQTDRAIDVAEKLGAEVKAYRQEKAVAMWIRSMKLATAPASKALSAFFGNLRRPFKKVK